MVDDECFYRYLLGIQTQSQLFLNCRKQGLAGRLNSQPFLNGSIRAFISWSEAESYVINTVETGFVLNWPKKVA